MERLASNCSDSSTGARIVQRTRVKSLCWWRRRRAEIFTDEAEDFPRTGLACLDEHAIANAERVLGCQLPPLFREVYKLVGNGGFGPGYGLLPLLLDRASSDIETVVNLHTAFRTSDTPHSERSMKARHIPKRTNSSASGRRTPTAPNWLGKCSQYRTITPSITRRRRVKSTNKTTSKVDSEPLVQSRSCEIPKGQPARS